MNVNDSITPANDSWVDYCDALAKEAWLESQQRGLLNRKPGSRVDLRDRSKSVPVPEDPSTLNAG